MRVRKNQFIVRLTDEELSELNKKVKKTGMSREGYIRTLISGYKPVEIAPLGYSDLAKELNHIGTNLNQIAAIANSKGFIDSSAYQKNYSQVMKICDLLLTSLLPQEIKEDDVDNGVL